MNFWTIVEDDTYYCIALCVVCAAGFVVGLGIGLML